MRPSVLTALAALATLALPLPLTADDWPAWRGPRGDGTSSETGFPLHWSPTRNVRWRVDLPDRGNSTPVVWGDRLFLTQSVEKEQTREVRAYDRRTGRMLWKSATTWEAKEDTHEENPYAAASPVTDGERVIAAFGPAGVWAFDLEGRKLWSTSLGPQSHQWGYASSPALHGNHAYVYQGPGPGSKLVALDKKTGAIAWTADLPEPVPTERNDGFKGRLPGVIGAFSTPLVVRAGGRDEIVVSVPESLRAFDPVSGSELWRASGLNPLVYSSPFLAGNSIIAMGGFNGATVAVRPGGAGDVTATHRVWHEPRARKNRIGSGVARDGHLYLINQDGFAECLELATGRQLWEERLNGPGANDASWSATTLAGDRWYAVNRSGDTFVLRAAPVFELLATNTVAEPMNASPVMSDGEIFLRTWKGLWCISEKGRLASR
jgi:outer membrane protein assembly factor BamB